VLSVSTQLNPIEHSDSGPCGGIAA